MKKQFTFFLFIIAMGSLMLTTACGDSGTRPDGANRSMVSASATAMPDWAVLPRNDSQYVYFAGSITKSPDLATGRQQATIDALYQLVSFIGLRANIDIRENLQYREGQDVSSYISEITRQVGAVSTANVTVEVTEVYYEKYSDGTFDMYVLIRFPKAWVERERARIAALVAQQRTTATQYLTAAKSALASGDIAKALDGALSAYYVAIQASENGDLYDESKNMIYSILTSLSFKLVSSPKYAYYEGGSDRIEISVVSTMTGKPVAGLKIEASEDKSLAAFVSAGGYSTDANGRIAFTMSELTANSPQIKTILGLFYFSMDKMENMASVDKDFFDQIATLQRASALQVGLELGSRSALTPTAVVVVSAIQDSNRFTGTALAPTMQESVSKALAGMGYNVISIEIPASTVNSLSDDEAMKAAIIKFLKTKYPDVLRVCYVFEAIIDTGVNPVNASMRNAEVRMEVTLIDMTSGEVEGGVSLVGRGYGLNVTQAAQLAEQKIKEKLPAELANL